MCFSVFVSFRDILHLGHRRENYRSQKVITYVS